MLVLENPDNQINSYKDVMKCFELGYNKERYQNAIKYLFAYDSIAEVFVAYNDILFGDDYKVIAGYLYFFSLEAYAYISFPHPDLKETRVYTRRDLEGSLYDWVGVYDA